MLLKLRSIKFQILAAFFLLALPLVLLAYSIFLNQQAFSDILSRTIEQERFISLTAAIERDVVDLQRNVLIYKDTTSAGAVKNFNALYQSINENLMEIAAQEGFASDKATLASVERHVLDYKNNFDVVVEYRGQRETLVNDFMHARVDALSDNVVFSAMPQAQVEKIQFSFLSAHNDALSYLASGDAVYIQQFKQNLQRGRKSALAAVTQHGGAAAQLAQAIEEYESTFFRVVTLTRNYVYLINVVMAGSAREILYNANILGETSRAQIKQEHQDTVATQKKRRQIIITLSLFGLGLALIVPSYFFRLITKPITDLAKVFVALSQGEGVTKIPGQDRSDEIGVLARAADVFRKKNEQTKSLLILSEESVLVQEQLNEDLLEEKRRAEAALSAKTEFLANMSHELRTPLNSVIGYTVRLLKKPEGLSERQLTSLETVERNGRHLLAMINDVLDFSKIEAEKLELHVKPVDICQLCADVVDQIRPSSEEKGLRLDYVPCANTLELNSDPVRVTQVLINLLSNAVKYTQEGTVSLTLLPDYDARTIRIDVVDTGLGIKDEDMSRLFQRFEQFDSHSRFKIGHGTGLGLAIVASLVPLLGGRIAVESVFGQGSCFTVTLPFDAPPPQEH